MGIDKSNHNNYNEELPTTITIHWVGIFFNTTLYSTLFLLVWIIFTRKHLFCYVPRSYFISMCLGFWCAIVVAWGCDVLNNISPYSPRPLISTVDFNNFNNSVTTIEPPPAEEWNCFRGTINRTFGYYELNAQFSFATELSNGNRRLTNIRNNRVFKLGWPAYCLIGQPIHNWKSYSSIQTPSEARLDHFLELIAVPSYSPGLIINWIFYSVLIAVIVVGIPRFIKWNRKRKHLCIVCKYPLGELVICPECGKKLG